LPHPTWSKETNESHNVPHGVEGYEERAHECAWLANCTDDQLIRGEPLRLRQTYLDIPDRLRDHGFEDISHRKQNEVRPISDAGLTEAVSREPSQARVCTGLGLRDHPSFQAA
jgi:hypothetical protein